MRDTPARGALLALALLAALAAGCRKKDAPAPAPNPGGDPANPPPERDDAADKEDPEVLAYFNQKGWALYKSAKDWSPNIGIPGSDDEQGEQVVCLGIGHADIPLDQAELSTDDYKMIAKSKALQVLNLSDVACSAEGLAIVAGIPRMEGIIINGGAVTDAGLKALARSRSLEAVKLFRIKNVSDAGLRELAALPKLRSLDLMDLDIDGSGFEAFAGSKTLTSIRMDALGRLTSAGATHLGKIPGLNELRIDQSMLFFPEGERREATLTSARLKAFAVAATRLPATFVFDRKLIDDDILAALVANNWYPTLPEAGQKPPSKPEEVQSISLYDLPVGDRGFAALVNCTNVRFLELSQTRITDEALKKMSGFKHLEYVRLNNTKVTGAGLEAIAGAPIRNISLWGCALTEDAFKAIGKMTALEVLDLSDARLKPEWFKHIAGLPRLAQVNLKNTAFDDTAVKYLTSLPGLRRLELDHTNLADAGLLELIELSKLTRLGIAGTNVSRAVRRRAAEARSELNLWIDDPKK